MAKGGKLRLGQIARARELFRGLPAKDDSITKEEGAGLLENDFRKMLKKGYSPKEISAILKNEGIIIPAYLVKNFLTPEGKTPNPASARKKPAPEKKPEKTVAEKKAGKSSADGTFTIKPDTPLEEL